MDYTVNVYCDDESTGQVVHGGRRVTILRYYWDGGGWHSQSDYAPHLREAANTLLRQHLVAEGVFGVPVREANAVAEAAGVTQHPHQKDMGKGLTDLFHCKLCGLDLKRHRNVVEPVLDRLRENEVSAISLRQLQRLVRAT